MKPTKADRVTIDWSFLQNNRRHDYCNVCKQWYQQERSGDDWVCQSCGVTQLDTDLGKCYLTVNGWKKL